MRQDFSGNKSVFIIMILIQNLCTDTFSVFSKKCPNLMVRALSRIEGVNDHYWARPTR